MQIAQQNPLLKGIIAAGLSLLFAGLGHLFLKQYVRGFVFLLISGFIYMISGYWLRGMLLNSLCFIVAAFDAFSFARRGYGIL
jgi:TM2 domain-containing membrane protein YozV